MSPSDKDNIDLEKKIKKVKNDEENGKSDMDFKDIELKIKSELENAWWKLLKNIIAFITLFKEKPS